MQATGDLAESGESVIVDVGASKTEVSLIHTGSAGVRELRTVGSESIGGNAVRDEIVGLCLGEIGSDDPGVRGKVVKAVEVALEGDHRVIVGDHRSGIQ
jgi:molecular chaperone DnaK (HSP70)